MRPNGQLEVSTEPGVVVFYDDAPAARRALRMLANVANEIDELPPMRMQLWQFHLLEDSCGDGAALEAAAAADVLVIAVSRLSALPPGAARWIESCLSRKAGIESAVVVLLNAAEDELGGGIPWLDAWRDAATAAGLDFFSSPWRSTTAPDSSVEGIHLRARSITRTLDGILHDRDSLSWPDLNRFQRR